MQSHTASPTSVTIPVGETVLHGQLELPVPAHGLVIFVDADIGRRPSEGEQRVAAFFREAELGTLRLEWFTPTERALTNPHELVRRLRAVTQWARLQPETAELLIGYFASGTGAAAAMSAASAEGAGIAALVTRAGRVELASPLLPRLQTPTLLIAGSNDREVLAANLEAWAQLRGERSLEIIPGAGRLFEEPGALANVAALATRWFGEHLRKDLAAA